MTFSRPMTYEEARASIPDSAKWSCSFGYPGYVGYSEFYRDANGSRYEIRREGNQWEQHSWKARRVPV